MRRPRTLSLLVQPLVMVVCWLKVSLNWPWGNGDYDRVPGRDRPGNKVPMRCTACGHIVYVRRVRYSVRLTCPRCGRGKLKRA